MYFLQSLLPRFNFIMLSPPNQRSTEAWGTDSCCLCFCFFMKLFFLSRVGPLHGPQFFTWLLQHGFFMSCSFLQSIFISCSMRSPMGCSVGICFSTVFSMGCSRISALASGAHLLWSWCLQHSFSNCLPHWALCCIAIFTLFNFYFYRWATNLADRLSCTLQWIRWISLEPSVSSTVSSHADQVCSSLEARLAIYTQYQGYLLSTPNTCIYQATAMECSEQNRHTGQGTVVKMWLVSLCRQGMQEVHKADKFLLIWEWHSVTAVCAGMALFLVCRCTTRGSTLDLS